MPLVSVIIPVYNCREYLEKCLGSVIAQDFTDWETIVVDDGSTDGSGEICDSIASQDSRIRVLHQPNGGVSIARNSGIDQAEGLWIAFVDSDDVLHPSYLSSLLAATEDADLVNCGWEQNGIEYIPPQRIVEREDFINVFFQPIFNFGFVWGKLLRSEIIRRYGIRFSPGVPWAEDVLFVDEYLIHSRKASLVGKNLYSYTVRPGSGVRIQHPAASEFAGYIAAERLAERIKLAFSPKATKYFNPYAFLLRYVVAVLAENKGYAKRLSILRRLKFNRKEMCWYSRNRREGIFNFLVLHRQWWLLALIKR